MTDTVTTRSAGRAEPRLAPLIAIVGTDGSGKSTLAADVVATLQGEVRVASCYLGLGSGAMGERIKRWPLIGAALEARLARRARETRTAGARIPGLGTAMVVLGFSLARRRRFARMLALRRRGIAVVTDRYPQIEVAGFYDGPGLSAARAGGRAVARLAAYERGFYEAMAAHRPDLVIRLNIDAETAHARKPEHPLESLRSKVAVTPLLRFNGALIVDLDAREPYPDVLGAVLRLIRGTLANAAPPSAVAAR